MFCHTNCKMKTFTLEHNIGGCVDWNLFVAVCLRSLLSEGFEKRVERHERRNPLTR